MSDVVCSSTVKVLQYYETVCDVNAAAGQVVHRGNHGEH